MEGKAFPSPKPVVLGYPFRGGGYREKKLGLTAPNEYRVLHPRVMNSTLQSPENA